MSRMNYRRFLIANALGGLLWGVSFTLLGYFAGTALTRIEKYASWVGLAVLIAMILFFLVFHFVKKRRETNEEAAYVEGVDDSTEHFE
jgi:membrane protein DedA with SNARE-associated domain